MATRAEYFTRGGRFGSRSIGSPSPALPPRRPPEGAIGDAVLRWGGPSNFQIASSFGGTFITQPRFDDLPDPEELDEGLGLIFTETARLTTTVRISNPLDVNDFVDVEKIDQISFRGPDNVIRTFVLNN